MYSFFAYAFKIYKMGYYDAKQIFLERSIWVTKNAEFYADFKFVDGDLNECP